MGLDELRERRKQLKRNSDITLGNMQALADESNRVAEVAHNSRQLLDDLDLEFESQTGLKGNDVKFLFAAVALQVTRIVILNELTKTENAGSTNRNETKLHEFQEKLLGKFNSGEAVKENPYYASMEHIITKMGVPYDATATLTEKSLSALTKKDREWDFDVSEMLPKEKLSLFKGANHRFATLGHDPILGLLFGTGNIMTNTITCVKTPVSVGGMGIPVLTTNHVVFTSDYKDPRIATYGSTLVMFQHVFERTKDQPSAFVASLIKQIIHIGTDLYTPCGIQIPGANLILSNAQVEKLTSYISTGDIIKVGASARLAELINLLISTLHTLMYDSSMVISRNLYSVKTRKIIMYSNAIATGSNVLWVGGNMLAGNERAIKQLDIGGLIVTIKRLMNDTEYIRQIKEEFIFGDFNKMIQGKKLNLKEPIWD
ncbi:hypothetical protein DW020_10200 [Clostridium sp. AF37-5AT]|nr:MULTISPECIES: hypothetical protein [unclassified Clostridium]RHO94757.1 hypothetical protein DW020_10200 [Clostridium sp. AF37-5AT]RHR03532.1 hypothetical protein DWX64_10090 [Clostridium sp. AF20-17LB]